MKMYFALLYCISFLVCSFYFAAKYIDIVKKKKFNHITCILCTCECFVNLTNLRKLEAKCIVALN